MEAQTDAAGDDLATMREQCRTLEESISARREAQLDLIASLQHLVPDLVPSLDRSLRLIAAFNGRPFVPTPNPSAFAHAENPSLKPHHRRALPELARSTRRKTSPGSSPASAAAGGAGAVGGIDAVRTMVAVCLLELIPFAEIDAAALARRLQAETSSASEAERAALAELAAELGGSVPAAVALALRRIAEDSGGLQVEEAFIGGKQMTMVWAIDRSKLLKELPESASVPQVHPPRAPQEAPPETDTNSAMTTRPQPAPQQPDMWGHPMPPMFPRPRGMAMPGMPRMPPGLMQLQRPFMAPGPVIPMGGGPGPSPTQLKHRTEEEDLKDLELLLNKKTYREKQNTKTGEELLDLIHRPTAKETAVAAKFKTKGGSQLKEYCTNLTKEDCRRQTGSFVACGKVHFRRIIAPHTDTNLGDCSFLDTCRHTKTCKYVHYELDQTPDVPPMMAGTLAPPRQIKPQRAEYCSEIELGESQWINCDIRNFRMDILGQFGVIMADPPWDIHMELPYGTMADDEMRTLNVPSLQTDGLIFLWVTGRAMELGRECLELWGYKRVEEIIWVKTNQLQRIIRTGRTGHWLNHSKEHCLVGIKGNPLVNRNIDTDVIVAEVRETSRKPDEMYAMLERISPRTRKLELFARMHNTQAGWLSLGNQLNGVRLVDEGLRARYKAAYPDVEVQPPSPPRTSAPMDVDQSNSQKPIAAPDGGERPA
ncbi:probable N6-adenosine-methyltransferase MT-A70-like [Phragmites australis]|uniref:probable N6-adenosine-methyltransferase MT-A70-like n=1 Tax=Phragmites australis TaxID=29695 RepID=UPI002D7934DB|nr:probable N6-adenosine-methyltransferase MT-A70-like [Phragmites australis]